MHHDDYMAHYALLAKKRQYRSVKPRAWDWPLTWPVLLVLGIVIAIIVAIQIW